LLYFVRALRQDFGDEELILVVCILHPGVLMLTSPKIFEVNPPPSGETGCPAPIEVLLVRGKPDNIKPSFARPLRVRLREGLVLVLTKKIEGIVK
jgi:hypothetical protein